MGHKKLDTTQHYLFALMAQTNSDEAEYISKAAQTKEEAMKLKDAGFQYVQTIDGYHIYRKRK